MKIFGTHFATLDIRQDSRIHQKVIDDLVNKYSDKDASTLKNSEKVEILMSGNIIANPNDPKNQQYYLHLFSSIMDSIVIFQNRFF